LVRALEYLHQQRPPLVLGGLRAEDVALPEDGPAQVISLGALSIVASSPAQPGQTLPALPGVASDPPAEAESEAPTEPEMAAPEEVSAALEAASAVAEEAPTTPEAAAAEAPSTEPPEAPAPPCAGAPDRGSDLWSLGVLLRELAGGAEVVARVMDRQRRPEQTNGEEAPPISLALAEVIEMASDDDPDLRFQNALAFEHALRRALGVEQRIARLDTQPEQRLGTVDMSLELAQEELATRQFPVVRGTGSMRPVVACWKCGGRNRPGASYCRVCGARLPTLSRDDLPRPRRRTTRRLADDTLPRVGRVSSPRRTSALLAQQSDPWRRLLWAFVWASFAMALLLGSASVFVAYKALH
jgi:serine/threonine protein kinase